MDAGELGVAARRRRVLPWLAALPPVLATAAVLGFAISELAGHTPFSGGPLLNAAEAAGAGSGAELLRLLRAGQDPHAILPIRPDVISSSVRQASTIEAAVWSRTIQIVDLLDREGALAMAAERHQMLCLARDLRADEIVAYLARTDQAPCEDGQALAAVQARTAR